MDLASFSPLIRAIRGFMPRLSFLLSAETGGADLTSYGGDMRAHLAANSLVEVAGNNLTLVYLVLGVSLVALAIALALRAQVLSASDGTEKMKEIASAVQEGAAAYLARQFRTLSFFVVIVFVLLFALPGDTNVKIGRSIFFLVGAAFSALVGYQGMWLAVRANVRVAEAARQGSAEKSVQIAFRTGGVVGMLTVGLGLLGASIVVAIYRADAPAVLEGFGIGRAHV